MLRFMACREKSRRDLSLLCTPNIHTNFPVSFVYSPVASSSSLTSFSTPLDKAGCAKIHKMYVRNGLSVGLEILHGSQSTMASQLSQISTTWPKALSSSKASFSTPIAKEEYPKIHNLQRSNQKRFDLAMHAQYAYDTMTDRFLVTEKNIIELIQKTKNIFHQEIFSSGRDECCLEEV